MPVPEETSSIDIGDKPDLVALAEKVQREGHACVLRLNGNRLALVLPISTGRRNRELPLHKPTAADIAAFRSAAGSWSDVDAEALKRYIREGRSRPAGPPVEL